jgi:hypothetical protein
MKGVRFLILVLALLAFAFVPTAAAPLSDPCPPGTAYHPACDVDDNGVINIDDIMRTASRWLTSGPAVSDNNHDHLGQTWTGSNNPLRIEGSFSDPNSSPLVVVNSDLLGGGILVDTLGSMGIEVERAGYSGVYVHNVGNAPVTNQSVDACGFQVAGVQGHGLWVGRASKDGVSVYRAGTVDTPVDSSEANGFEVAGAQGNGLFVGRALGDGVHIRSTTDDGIQLGEDGVSMPYGLYVPPPGTMYSTLLPDTAAANGEWALYTEDKIRAANVAMDAQTLVAVVGGDQPLAAGDVVTAVGLADVLPAATSGWRWWAWPAARRPTWWAWSAAAWRCNHCPARVARRSCTASPVRPGLATMWLSSCWAWRRSKCRMAQPSSPASASHRQIHPVLPAPCVQCRSKALAWTKVALPLAWRSNRSKMAWSGCWSTRSSAVRAQAHHPRRNPVLRLSPAPFFARASEKPPTRQACHPERISHATCVMAEHANHNQFLPQRRQ